MSFEKVLEDVVRRVIREELDARRTKEPEGLGAPLTVIEAAAQIRVHPNTIRRGIASGALKADRAGSAYRIRRVDLDAWIRHGGRTAMQADGERRVEELLAKSARRRAR
jgi:excisionase family DNA binding protein